MNPRGAGPSPISGCWLLPVLPALNRSPPPEPESVMHLSQDIGAGWFSDPRTTPTVDEAQHNATAITTVEDTLIDTLRLVIEQQSACRRGSRNRRIPSRIDW